MSALLSALHRAALQMGYKRAGDVPAYHAGELCDRATMIRGPHE